MLNRGSLRAILLTILGVLMTSSLTVAPAPAATIISKCTETSVAGTTAISEGAPSAYAVGCSGSETTPVQGPNIIEKQPSGTTTAVKWWGYQWLFSPSQVNTLNAMITAGAGVATVTAALCSGTVAGAVPCGVAYTVAAGLLVIGTGVLSYCNRYGRGIKLNFYWNGWWSCGTR